MTAPWFHNNGAAAAVPLSTLIPTMVETLAGFRASVRFASTDPASNRFRFYDLRWQPTLFGEGALVRVWGRQGQPGTVWATVYPDRDQAQSDIRSLVRRRLVHGYQVLDWH
jgi:predicted DNA-binding WGR domain protein